LVLPDDASVADTTDIYRLVPEFDVDWDHDESRWIVKSSAFQNTSTTDRMSVVLGDTLATHRRPPEDARRSKPDRFVVALYASEFRAEEQGVIREPTPDEPSHGNVVGQKQKNRRRRLARLARWIVDPAPPL
jgi:hypothetical protein